MYVILIYDIPTVTPDGQRRIVTLMKKCRQYLHHTQKSVFEGELSQVKLMELITLINKIINKNEDYVIIYEIENKKNINKRNIGVNFDATNNVI